MNFGALSDQFGADKARFICYHSTIDSEFFFIIVRSI